LILVRLYGLFFRLGYHIPEYLQGFRCLHFGVNAKAASINGTTAKQPS